ncbi:MAG: phosphate/phosphite/phosphonate ABC transporter substrate-binding protein [gamma proteobacterium symbiont of Taylorina sp.]|nr:phosphate/phosphite/phosphonate ABC transporter substrate-binding protein [gamma proteobacterium symbiont of Taylorina sp.]
MKKTLIILFALMQISSVVMAENARNHEQKNIIFGIVPQQSASKLARLWTPIFKQIGERAGVTIKFRTAPDIPTFEKRVSEGEYDIAYMNPYHYTVFSKKPGYVAFAKALDKKIKGILVVRKDSLITELDQLSNQSIAFPAPAAFAASVLPRSHFVQMEISIKAKYVSSHDSVYRNVAKGLYPAGGGVIRTFNNMQADIRNQLKILWTTRGYTPHAFAAHPRVADELLKKIQQAMFSLNQSEAGKLLLKSIKLKGITTARDSDWDDVRGLKIDLIKL